VDLFLWLFHTIFRIANKHNALDDAIHQAKQFIAINKQKVVSDGFRG